MSSQQVAIVGMSCRFPGADHYDAFWENLIAGKNLIGETPLSRWDWREHVAVSGSGAGEHARWAGYTSAPEMFDAAFFGISPREAERMDPQQRVVLEQAWHCIQDAGKDPRTLMGQQVGVYIAAGGFDYKEIQEAHSASPEGHEATGVHNSIIANRVSYFFNLTGPSVVVDTACSSSLVAIQQAVSALQLGQCDSALVGGVGLLLTPTTFIRFGKMGMLSPTGQCRAFDADANGYVRGEGVGMVMLKPLDQALADGDRIWGVIKSVAINHGGRARSLTSPSALAQAKLIVDAVQQAEIPVQSINFIETHGTGTPLGDPIEIHGLTRAFNQLEKQGALALSPQSCGLGAVKASIGHLECAAGMAGLIKVLLAMKHRVLPGHANFSSLNPRIKLADSPFYVVDGNRHWAPALDEAGNEFPLRAGISSFGFGGVNGHLIVEEPPRGAALAPALAEGASLLSLSAASPDSLRALAADYAQRLAADPARYALLCAAANQAQPGLRYRKALVSTSAQALRQQLLALQDGAIKPARSDRKLAFVFSGQGAQYAGMGAQLYQQNAAFKQALDDCEARLLPLLGRPLLALMFNREQQDIHLTEYTQPALFALEYGLSKMWQSMGIQPDFIIGHSIGELVGACVAGVLSLDDAIKIVVARGRLMGSISALGKMAAIFASETQVRELLAPLSLAVDIAAVNGPNSIILSGSAAAVEAAVAAFAARGIDSRYLNVSQAFHSSLMEPILASFRDQFKGIRLAEPRIKLISNLTGQLETELFATADYWVNHLRNTVNFQAGVESLIQQGVTDWLEIGPSSMLLNLAKRTLDQQGCEARLIESMKPDEEAKTTLLGALAALFEAGCDPQWSSVCGKVNPGCVDLPRYPFDRQAYWVPLQQKPAKRLQAVAGSAMPGRQLPLALASLACFEADPIADFGAYLLDHQVKGFSLMPAAGFIACASSALARAGVNPEGLTLAQLKFLQPFHLQQEGAELQTLLTRNAQAWQIQIAGRAGGDDDWTIYATADGLADAVAQPAARLDRAQLDQFKLIASIPQADFYRQCHAKGLEYGPAFRPVVQAIESNARVYGHLHLPQDCPPLGEDTAAIHPSLLDGALQLVTLLAATTEQKIPLPVAVSRFRLYARGDSYLYAIAEHQDAQRQLANITLYNQEGALVGFIEGLEYRWVAAAQIAPAPSAAAGDCYFTPAWQARELPATGVALQRPLLLSWDTRSPLASGLAARYPGARLCALGDTQAVAACLQQPGAVDSVWCILPPEQGDDLYAQHPGEALEQLLGLAQQLLAQGYGELALRWVVISAGNGAAALQSQASPEVSAQGLALAGFVRSLCKEQAQWRASHVDLPDHRDPAALIALLERALADQAQDEWVLRNGQGWYRALVRPSQPLVTSAKAFRQGGVYVITGGAQGIGAALAAKLASEWAAKLILLGRSPRGARHLALEQQLASLGGEAIYLAVDVADYTALRAAILQASQQFGPINGLIHSAGVIQDGLVQQMSPQALQQVCAPKIQGTLNLYRAVNDQPLDFMLLFSSVMSWLAYPGQANYVAANAFVDGIAPRLASQGRFPVKVINWGHWGETGMASSAFYRERIARLGIHEIATAEGLAAIDLALAQDAAQWVVMKAEERVLAEMGVLAAAGHGSAQAPAADFALPSLAQLQDLQSAATQELLVASLGALIAGAMRMDSRQLLADKAAFLQLRFTSLGIDSLTTVDLRKRIRDWLGVDVPADVLIGGALIGEVIDLLKQQLLLQRLSQASSAAPSQDEGSHEDEEVFVL